MRESATHQNTIPPLRVVITKEEGVYVARCLEYCIASHGHTIEEAQAAFVDALVKFVLVAEHSGENPFASPRPDDTPYHQMWENGRRSGASPTPMRIPGFKTCWKDQEERIESTSVEQLVICAA